jgi:hypothetical protein
MSRIVRPHINPLQFYLQSPSNGDSRFLSKDFEDWYFSDTILPWQSKPDWKQPFQTTDTLHDQLQTDLGPVTLKMYDCQDRLIDTIPYDQIRQNYNDPDLYIYEVDVDLTGYTPGTYYFTISFGTGPDVILQSEYIDLQDSHDDTLFLEFSNDTFREDMIFETGIQPGIRVHGTKKYKGPASKNTMWEDQVLNESMIRSVNYRIWTLILGGSYGLPDYMADKLDRMLSCGNVWIDGKQYTKQDGSLEPSEIDDYPLRGWRIDLREKLNRASRHIEDGTPQNTTVAVLVNVDSKGFGTDTGGSETVISDVI